VVDVAAIEPATTCLQSGLGKTLEAIKCFAGVAYTNHERNLRSLITPRLHRILAAVGSEYATECATRNKYQSPAALICLHVSKIGPATRIRESHCRPRLLKSHERSCAGVLQEPRTAVTT